MDQTFPTGKSVTLGFALGIKNKNKKLIFQCYLNFIQFFLNSITVNINKIYTIINLYIINLLKIVKKNSYG